MTTAYLFDTDALSEVVRPLPSPAYSGWLRKLDRDLQFTSAIVVGELYHGAFRSQAAAKHIKNIQERLLPSLTVLPYDVPVARRYGELRAELERKGQRLADADLQIAVTALEYGLELVTGNIKHFARVDGLKINRVLAESRLAD